MVARYFGGIEAQAGDQVRCIRDGYASIHRGMYSYVQRVEDGCIVLNNNLSPHGTSPYRAHHFELTCRTKPQETKYMHVAILTPGEGFSYAEFAKQINNDADHLALMADTNGAALKQRVKERIERHPDEVWLVLGGAVIASGKRRSDVDVSFRSL